MGEDERAPIEVELVGRQFKLICKPWPHKVARRWLVRLTKRVLSAVAQSGTDEINGLALIDGFDEATLEAFLDDCESHTEAQSEDGKGVKFSTLTPLLTGRMDVMLKIAREHAEVQFAPFFASLGSALVDLREQQAEEATEGKGEPSG